MLLLPVLFCAPQVTSNSIFLVFLLGAIGPKAATQPHSCHFDTFLCAFIDCSPRKQHIVLSPNEKKTEGNQSATCLLDDQTNSHMPTHLKLVLETLLNFAIEQSSTTNVHNFGNGTENNFQILQLHCCESL